MIIWEVTGWEVLRYKRWMRSKLLTNFDDMNQKFKQTILLLSVICISSCSSKKHTKQLDYESIFLNDSYFKNSSSYTVQGVVLNYDTEQPMKQMFVWVEGSSKGVKSDDNGYFTFEIPSYVLKDTMVLHIKGGGTQPYSDDYQLLKSNLPLKKKFYVMKDIDELIIMDFRTPTFSY